MVKGKLRAGKIKKDKAKNEVVSKKLESELEEAEEEVEEINGGDEIAGNDVNVKGSKPVGQVKKGDKVKVDGKEYTVDAHYVLIDHGTTKEMAIECYDSADKDYQLRYFSDQAEMTMEFYELQEIMFIKKVVSKVEW